MRSAALSQFDRLLIVSAFAYGSARLLSSRLGSANRWGHWPRSIRQYGRGNYLCSPSEAMSICLEMPFGSDAEL